MLTWIPIATEANHDKALLFRHDGLVDMPRRHQVWKDDGTHDSACGFR